MAESLIVATMVALLSHQLRKTISDETFEAIGQKIIGVSGSEIDKRIKTRVKENTSTKEFEEAIHKAHDCFYEKINDYELAQWMFSLPLGNLPNVIKALDELPYTSSESNLKLALQEAIVQSWKKLTPKQIDQTVHVFLICLRKAMLPIEKQTLQIIGKSVLQTQEQVNLLVRWFEEYIISDKSAPILDISSSEENRDSWFDIQKYSQEINRLYEDANIEEMYIPLDGWLETHNSERVLISLDDYIVKWLTEIDGHLALLGDYGTGKSWFCLRVAKYLLDRYQKDPENKIFPLLITFKRYKHNMDLVELIREDLRESYGIRIESYSQLEILLRSKKVLPILDGMDEMAKEVGAHTALVTFTRLGIAREVSKAIISCRTHYFHSGSEEREILGLDKKNQILGGFSQFNVVQIRPFTPDKILASISRKFNSEKTSEILDFVRNTYNLPELCTRPVLLSMICDSYEMLPGFDFTITSSDLYNAYIDSWLKQELQFGRLLLDPKIVKTIFEDLAEEMVIQNTLIIQDNTLKSKYKEVMKSTNFPNEIWEAIARQLTTSTFISRYGLRDWQFAHRSFQEYFYASKFFRWEMETEGKGVFSVVHIPVWQFIAQMVLNKWDKEKAVFWVEPRVKKEQDGTLTQTTLRAAAAYWLIKKKVQNLWSYPLFGIMLDSVNLTNLDLSRCDFSSSDFHNSDLSGSTFRGTIFESSDLRAASFQGADLRGANLKFCSIDDTDFRGVNFGSLGSDKWMQSVDDLGTCRGLALFDDEIYTYLGM